MRTTYRALAYFVIALVAVQAAAIAFGFFGLGSWIEGGNDMTKSVLESSGTGVTGEGGLMIHSILGMYVMPLAALAMLIVSLFARFRGGIKWAALILVDTIAQVLLALAAFGSPALGIVHGLNAFLLVWLAVMAVLAVGHATEAPGSSVPHAKVAPS